AVADRAVGRALIALFALLAVHPQGIVAGLVRVARAAHRLGNPGRMRVLVVFLVTGFAGQPRVRALLEFRPLLVARSAIGGFEFRGGCPQNANQGGTEPQPGQQCSVLHQLMLPEWSWRSAPTSDTRTGPRSAGRRRPSRS